MTTTKQMQTRPAPVDLTRDPRIESPEVKVVYPSPEQPVRETPTEQAKPVEQPAPAQQARPEQKQAEHSCKVDLQQAIKQNAVAFVLMILAALGVGYLLGKKS